MLKNKKKYKKQPALNVAKTPPTHQPLCLSHTLQTSNRSVQILLSTPLSNSLLHFPINPINHMLTHGILFSIFYRNLVVQTLLDSIDQIGLPRNIFSFQGIGQVDFPLFLDKSKTVSLFLESVNSVDFGR